MSGVLDEQPVQLFEESRAPGHYKIICRECGTESFDDGLCLACPQVHPPALLTTKYKETRFRPLGQSDGIYRYSRWLPVRRGLVGSARTLTFRNDRLNHAVGLRNLWLAFNGYWPEKGACMTTCTFKELEAFTVLARIPATEPKCLVIASAGNTALAFAHACNLNRRRAVVIVPESALQQMRMSAGLCNGETTIVALSGNADYADAISLAGRLATMPGFVNEGGCANVGRRDGLGTVLLNAAESIGCLPHFYFQAIGSGAGAIAVHEAAKRLIADGEYGSQLPRLMLSQNLPFAPIYAAWRTGRREWKPPVASEAKEQIQEIDAKVLSNRHPPYSITGGVFDVLTESGGTMLAATNLEATSAGRRFEDIVGIDIEPASAVALATLLKAIAQGLVTRDNIVLLNVTGGGAGLRRQVEPLVQVIPHLTIKHEEMNSERSLDRIRSFLQ